MISIKLPSRSQLTDGKLVKVFHESVTSPVEVFSVMFLHCQKTKFIIVSTAVRTDFGITHIH